MYGNNVFIGYNPPTSVNPYPKYPSIHTTVFISPFTLIIGDVTIRENVFIAPFVSVRADEGTPFYIGEHTNLQDGVILHGLRDQYVIVNDRKYSIYIGRGVSCAHSSLIHGPCLVEDDVFIGFSSTVFNSQIGKGTFISSGAVVTNGVILKPNSFVPPGASIDTQEKANSLVTVPLDREEFAREVQRVNNEFPSAYSMFFGSNKCSCGLTC
ncbi:carbonate dehydratase [Anaerobacillus alkaliphilus]|uniref:Carbonate dehydratase n=2 Tax=Anaerobacillus alkaliphilus TaxID=1548597 RepID=A0A4Q0VWB1_9BACI|nr:carbonate dehydratase [Anaerobacillus alkaliphilus]RXJ02491.1 carbonate dehydratase [Anaerobacillus alkaliphilus]